MARRRLRVDRRFWLFLPGIGRRRPGGTGISRRAEPSRAEPSRAEEEELLAYDFGVRVARNQTLKHEFRLPNPTDRPLSIVGSKVNVPCCSRLGPLPEAIPPGGEGVVPVFLKASEVAEGKRVSFTLKTDSPTAPTRTLVVSALFVPEWELQEVSAGTATLKVGQAAERTYRVVGRRQAGEGRKVPAEVTAEGPIAVEPAPAVDEVESSARVIESTRTLVVRLLGQAQPGPAQGTLGFRWPDGFRPTRPVAWTVVPRIRLFPGSLLLKPRAGITEAVVEVRSPDRPCRILHVAGPLVAAPIAAAAEARTDQTLRIRLETSRFVAGINPAIEVTTDDPVQPHLQLGVLIVPDANGANR